MKIKKDIFLLILVLILAFLLRTTSLNWDQNQHLHPDERFLTMVVSDIKLPINILNYFDANTSSLNPSNHNYDFYAYGNFPLLLTKIVATIFSQTSYNQVFLVGRILSAIFDTGIILILYLLSKLLGFKSKIRLSICFLYALSIFPIQLSHFFTVDTFTVFFLILSIFIFLKFLKTSKFLHLIFSGIFLGIGLSCKTSIIILLPLFILFIFIKSAKFKKFIYPLFFVLFIFLAFRIFQPYAFDGILKFSSQFLKSIFLAQNMITGQYLYPPNIQWYSTIPIIHPLINIFLFGLGPVVFILCIFGFYQIFIKNKSYKDINFLFILLSIFLFFIYQGVQLAKYMRYFYPVYPLLIIFAGVSLQKVSPVLKKIIIFLSIIFTMFFLNIYFQENSRITASKWIYQNIKSGSVLSSEYWDDSLPLNLDNQYFNLNYKIISLPFFDSDDSLKWNQINQSLSQIDYLILSSNRLWRSISNDQKDYPITSQFYQDLFSQKINFKLIKDFYSYPGINLPFLKKCFLIGWSGYPNSNNSFFKVDPNCVYPGIYFRDNIAEESFTVYDHPQVFIFSRL
ncbi:MAG: glycosyltransferase family 39 protein [Candidatus Shapirobacteria bacterium]|nr:glycosyltransferase family 39 protein [Candidatus Shapirobacteria bacterium]